MMKAVLVLAPSLEVEGEEEAAEGAVKMGFSVAMMVEELGLEVREATGKESEKDSLEWEKRQQ